MKKKSSQVLASILLTITVAGSLAADDRQSRVVESHQSKDHIVVLASASTIDKVIKRELSSTQYIKQIAQYNDIDDLAAIIPEGSVIKIPEPYREVLQSGVVSYAKGDTTLTTAHTVVNPVGKGTRISKGDVLRTGEDGFVSLSFRSGTVLNIQPASQVVIADIDCLNESTECLIALQANEGVMSSRVTPRAEGSPPVRYSIETPFLTAAVRGTQFYVDVRSDSGRLGVTEGLVGAESSLGVAELPRGQGWLAESGRVPQQVYLLPPPNAALRNGDIFSNEDMFYWQTLDDAVAYQLTVSADLAQDRPISHQALNQTSAVIPVLTKGEFFVSVAGIDSDDFVGLSTETIALRYADIDDRVSPPALDIVRGQTVDVLLPNYNGMVEVAYGESVDRIAKRLIHDTANGSLSLPVDPQRPLAIRARKVLGEYRVSRYSNLHVFEK